MNRTWSWLCLSACLTLSCGNTGSPPQDYGSLLEVVTEQVILPEHRDFVAKAQALGEATQALADTPDEDSLAAAQGAWRDARRAFRLLDALHFGTQTALIIVSSIDVFPIDETGIEAMATGTGAVDDQAVKNAGGRKKGFLGLEYLLFPPADGISPVLADDEAAERRRALALAMAHEIRSWAERLANEWEPSEGNYAQQVTLAGKGGAVYATQRAAVDDMVGGVGWALELVVGERLAQPLGRKTGGTPDPSLDATRRSDNSVADMQASLDGVIAMYSGEGFSAVVKGKSAALDQRVSDELTDGKAKLDAIPAPFAGSVVDDTARVQAAFDATSGLKRTWNTDVSSALGATVKPGDNDGD